MIPENTHFPFLLSRRVITKHELEAIGELRKLRILYLDQDSLETGSLDPLKNLSDLRYLNLTSSVVGKDALNTLSSLASLREVFLFQSGIPAKDIRQWAQSRPEVLIDTGKYTLPVLATDTITYRKK